MTRRKRFCNTGKPLPCPRKDRIAPPESLRRHAEKPVRQRRKGDNKRQKSVRHCVTRHCVKSARIAYLRPKEARRTNTRPIRSWREYLFIAHPCIMHVYAFMLRCRHSYAAPFRQKGLDEPLIREIAITKSRCQVHKRFPHSSSRTIPSMATACRDAKSCVSRGGFRKEGQR